MAETKYDIASRALLKLGFDSIDSFSDGTKPSTIAGQIYESHIKNLLTKGNWHFATKKQQLTKLDETPINEWTYSYELPTDLLKLRKIWTSDSTYILSNSDYGIFSERKLYSQYSSLWADYIYRADEGYWPYYFVEFVISSLASEFAMPLTRSADIASFYKQEAYGNNGLFEQASVQDSMQNKAPYIKLDYLANARFGLGRCNYR